MNKKQASKAVKAAYYLHYYCLGGPYGWEERIDVKSRAGTVIATCTTRRSANLVLRALLKDAP